jgi:hypothetical protein
MRAEDSRGELAGRFAIRRVLSPRLDALPPLHGTQAWFALEPHRPC